MSLHMSSVDFSSWLQNELEKRGWSQADLARMSGLNRQVISTYINRQRTKPDSEMLNAIARALRLPSRVVFEAAGILAPEKDVQLSPNKSRLLKMLDDIDDEELTESIIAMLEKQLEQKQKRMPQNGQQKSSKSNN